MTEGGHNESLVKKVVMAYTYVAIWIGLSGLVIMYNKYLLAYHGFPYPITLTMWHMFFCAALAIGLVKSGRVQAISMDRETYTKAIVPIGACYAITLWVGNAAYLYLSVSFIQMLKALMPAAVFGVGVMFGTEKYNNNTMINMFLVTVGVAIASYGELNFNLTGVLFQLSSIFSESIRLVMVQILLQSRGLKLNPVTTLYFVAPCCFCFLLIPFFFLEAGKIAADPNLDLNPLIFISNATAAFGLNMAVFLLIGKTSALTMNIAGVVKDWLLIGLSVWMFKSAVSGLNLFGYFIAFLAVCWYNYRKLQAMQAAAAPLQPPPCASVRALRSSAEGLTEAEAAARLRNHGLNAVAATGPPAWYRVLWSAFAHPFNAILLLLAGTAVPTQDAATAVIMLTMVSASTALRFWQELKSTVAAARLMAMVHTRATVVRRDARTGLPAEQVIDQRAVVPGDCVRLFAGEMMPGDVRILRSRDLYVGEAALTGESLPVEKAAAAAPPATPGAPPPPALLECRNLGFMGTHVVSGTGLGVVVATGGQTYLSTVADALSQRKPPNAFERGVLRVSYLLIAFMVCMVPLVMLLNGLRTGDWGQRTIVKRLDAVQNLGAMDILCADKTGTLTRDEVVLTRWLDWRGEENAGALRWASLNARFQTGNRNLLDAAILQSGEGGGCRAQLLQLGARLNADGLRVLAVAVKELPTAVAALEAASAGDGGSVDDAPGVRWSGSSLTPSTDDSSSSRGSAHVTPGGSPAAPGTPPPAHDAAAAAVAAAAPGAAPGGAAAGSDGPSYGPAVEAGAVFVGFLAFLDPPKPDAARAVLELADKSVRLKVLTGDSVEVACKVCAEVGLPVACVATGPELAQLGAAEFVAAVQRATVLGRLTPPQKARVVTALKGAGHTGNSIKYIKLAASSNFGNVFSVLIASALLPFAPMRPIQLLTQNLLYDLSQTAIPFDTMDASYLGLPRQWSAADIGRFMLAIGPISSIWDVATFAVLWFAYGANSPERQALFQSGWFAVGICTQTLIVHAIRTERLPFIEEVAAPPLAWATLIISAIGLALPATRVGAVERMTPLPPSFYAWVAAVLLAYMLCVQLAKRVYIRAFCSWLGMALFVFIGTGAAMMFSSIKSKDY
ncbi:magnesium-translocating P-type ATPase, partial [Micractinium conductrix]